MPTFYNQATLSYNDTQKTSNIVQGEIVGALTVTKNAVNTSYTAGDTVTYAIAITNSGNNDFTGLTLTDDLGAYAFGTGNVVPLTYNDATARLFINSQLQTDPTIASVSPLTITGIDIPANSSALILYTADANGFAPLGDGAAITNTATLNGGGLLAPVSDDATITNSTEPALNITKAVEPAVVLENGTITYTFTITNTGSQAADAGDNVSVSDIFDPILNITSVTLDGTALPAATGYTYDTASGTFTTVPGAITVPGAVYARDPVSGAYTVTPGSSTLVVSGTI